MRTRDLLPAFADALKFDFGFPDGFGFGFGFRIWNENEKTA